MSSVDSNPTLAVSSAVAIRGDISAGVDSKLGDPMWFEQAAAVCHPQWVDRFRMTATIVKGFTDAVFQIGKDKVPFFAKKCEAVTPDVEGRNYSFERYITLYPWFYTEPFSPLIKTDEKGNEVKGEDSTITLPYPGAKDVYFIGSPRAYPFRLFVDINNPGKFPSRDWRKSYCMGNEETVLDVYDDRDRRDIHYLVYSGKVGGNLPKGMYNPDTQYEMAFALAKDKFLPRVAVPKEDPDKKDRKRSRYLRVLVRGERPNNPDYTPTTVLFNSGQEWHHMGTTAFIPGYLCETIMSSERWYVAQDKWSHGVCVRVAILSPNPNARGNSGNNISYAERLAETALAYYGYNVSAKLVNAPLSIMPADPAELSPASPSDEARSSLPMIEYAPDSSSSLSKNEGEDEYELDDAEVAHSTVNKNKRHSEDAAQNEYSATGKRPLITCP